MSKLLLVLAAAGTLFTGALLSLDWVVVDVRDGDTRVVVPAPLLLARAALLVAPDDVSRIECPDELKSLRAYQPALTEIVAELRQAPDFDLVRVVDGRDSVLVRKVDDELRIDVDGGRGDEIHVAVPLSAVSELLASFDGSHISPSAVLSRLDEVDGDLVHVSDGDSEVRVHIW